MGRVRVKAKRFWLGLALVAALHSLAAGARADDLRRFVLPANDMVYDSHRQRIYLSVPHNAGLANTVTIVDPATGDVGPSIPIGPDPDRMALSDDGQFLYVATDGGEVVRRLDLRDLTVRLQFRLGSHPLRGPFQVEDMAVLPGQPTAIAISMRNRGSVPRHEGIAVFDNGVSRPNVSLPGQFSNRLQFGDSAARLYALSQELDTTVLRRLAIDRNGVTLIDTTENWRALLGGPVFGIPFDAGRLYTDRGQVIDPERLSLVGQYTGINFNAPVVPDAAGGRVYFLTWEEGLKRRIVAFDQRAFTQVGSFDLGVIGGGAFNFLRWGENGLAFRTDGDSALYLIRTSLILTEPLGLHLGSDTVIGGHSTDATVTLRGGAPDGGATLQVASSNPALARVPATVAVPAGATTASFAIQTSRVLTGGSATITVRYGALARAATLQVTPPEFTVSTRPISVTGGGAVTGTITLNEPAPAGGYEITLAVDPPGLVTVPARVTLPEGATSATFPVTTAAITAPRLVAIRATLGSATRATALQLLPVALQGLFLNPRVLASGATATGRVLLVSPSLAGGTVVQLTNSDPAASVPESVTVPAGQVEASFQIHTERVPAPRDVVITATFGSSEQRATLRLTPPYLAAFVAEPNPLTAGKSGTGKVTLSSPAPVGGMPVALTTDMPLAVSLPASVLVPAGATEATFSFQTVPLLANASVILTATAGGASLSVTLTLFSATPVVGSNSVFRLPLASNDIAYDPFSRRIYASVPARAGTSGNSIAVVDPVKGTIEMSVPMGTEPDRVALSDGGRYLYAALNGAAAVRRLTLPAIATDADIALGSDPTYGPYSVEEMQAVPGEPEAVAVVRLNTPISPGHAGVAIYDRRGQRPVTTPRHTGSHVIEFDADPSRLYGYDNQSTEFGFRRMRVNEFGVSVEDFTRDWLGGDQYFRYDSGFLYSSAGLVIDPEQKQVVGRFAGVPDPVNFFSGRNPTLVAPDVAVGRVFFLVGDGPDRRLLVYDQRTREFLGWVDIHGVTGTASRLLRWGADGLAFRTSGDQLFLIRTPLTPAVELTVSFSPGAVVGGGSATGLISLRSPAPAGGSHVALASSDAAARVPAAVDVPEGRLSATFAVETSPVPADVSARVTATSGSLTASASLGVLTPVVSSLTLDRGSVTTGGRVTATIALTGPAPAGGVAVDLSADRPTLVRIPARVVVPEGAKTASFTVQTLAITDPTAVQIMASRLARRETATLRIELPTLTGFTLTPDEVIGGEPVTGVLTISDPAPEAGLPVHLEADYSFIVQVPATVTIPAGETRASFTLPTHPTFNEYVRINAWIGTFERSYQRVTLEVLAPDLVSLTVEPPTVKGDGRATGTVTLNGIANEVGLHVSLTSSSPAVDVPAEVIVPPGGKVAHFPLLASPVAQPTTTVITARSPALKSTRTATLQVLPPVLVDLTVGPESVSGGSTATGVVILDSPAPEDGLAVALSSSSVVAAPPSQVIVPAGERTATFPIPTSAAATLTRVTVTASLGGQSRTASFSVRPMALAAFTVEREQVIGGYPTFATVTLAAPAPAGGVIVTLTNDQPLVLSLPPQVTIPAGSREVHIPIVTFAVPKPIRATLTATTGGESRNATLTVLPLALQTLTLDPNPILRGRVTAGTVTLNAPALPGGLVVTLSSENSKVAAPPPTLRVPAGATTATFPVQTYRVRATTEVRLSASGGGTTRDARLTVVTGGLEALTLETKRALGGFTVTAAVVVAGLAPAGGAIVRLTSSAPSVAPVPEQVVVTAGARLVRFPIPTRPTPVTLPVTITAEYAGTRLTATLTVVRR
jgi:hypothetical protein